MRGGVVTPRWLPRTTSRAARSPSTVAVRPELPGVAESFIAAFPDIEVFMDELVVKDDRVEYHWTFTGTSAETGKTCASPD